MQLSFSLLVALCLLLFALPPASSLSQSKLSVHSGPYDGDATSQLVGSGQPRVIKLLDSFGNVEKYKSMAPGMAVIGRVYLPTQPMSGDPKEVAEWWWGQVNKSVLANPSVDYWEGYNEPPVGTLEQIQWYSEFEQARVVLMAAHGLKAVIGCFSVGTPDVTNQTIIKTFLPAVQVAAQHGAWLGLHEYSAPHMWSQFDNTTQEGWLTGRYRKLYREYLIPNNLTLPCVVTETGLEFGWKMYSAAQYVYELSWYDSILREDSYMMGATIFLIDGTSDWDAFSINGQAADLLTQYLQKT